MNNNDIKSRLINYPNKKVEDTHTRSTFLIENQLLKRLNKLAKNRHGFKTNFINYAIVKALNELEEEHEVDKNETHLELLDSEVEERLVMNEKVYLEESS